MDFFAEQAAKELVDECVIRELELNDEMVTQLQQAHKVHTREQKAMCEESKSSRDNNNSLSNPAMVQHSADSAPEASGHGEGAHQGDMIEEWVCGVLTRTMRSGRQYMWAQGQWNLVLDTWLYKGHCDMMA